MSTPPKYPMSVLLEAYQRLGSATAVARELGMTRGAIGPRLRRAGISLRRGCPVVGDADLLTAYRERGTAAATGTVFGMSASQAQRRLRRLGVILPPGPRPRPLAERLRRKHDGIVRREYGLTPEIHEALLLAADGHCIACGGPPGYRGLHIDHDHASGRVRGLLCGPCNRALGAFDDSAPRMMVALRWLALPITDAAAARPARRRASDKRQTALW